MKVQLLDDLWFFVIVLIFVRSSKLFRIQVHITVPVLARFLRTDDVFRSLIVREGSVKISWSLVWFFCTFDWFFVLFCLIIQTISIDSWNLTIGKTRPFYRCIKIGYYFFIVIGNQQKFGLAGRFQFFKQCTHIVSYLWNFWYFIVDSNTLQILLCYLKFDCLFLSSARDFAEGSSIDIGQRHVGLGQTIDGLVAGWKTFLGSGGFIEFFNVVMFLLFNFGKIWSGNFSKTGWNIIFEPVWMFTEGQIWVTFTVW